MITGIDLVKEQVKIARGEKLSFTQDDLKINGHAIELRIYAEDPSSNFLPSTGNLKTYRTPDGPGVRVDSGYEEGMDIPVFYDPMIAKMTVHAATREDAIAKMRRAIDDFKIEGIENTLSFGRFVMQQEDFVKGHYDTHFVAKHFKPEYLQQENEDELLAAAIVAAIQMQKTSQKSSSMQMQTQTESGWRKRSTLR
jgi:acetyl/propionyl-CoA carboxylase alpha subunit